GGGPGLGNGALGHLRPGRPMRRGALARRLSPGRTGCLGPPHGLRRATGPRDGLGAAERLGPARGPGRALGP
ncbi:hypothetical protein, partial [Streptomyces sp. SID161]|uniref:hypothetical protein n=1 Tax=Streptomyces sp. SID161 TaxID=2690251 RepID=UPI001F3F9576